MNTATTTDCQIINHPATGQEFITAPNPDHVPATEGHFETVTNPDYLPATDGHFETVANPDHVPATPDTQELAGLIKWNWTGGPVNTSPAFPGEGWHQVGVTSDSKGAEPGVVHAGNGKGSYFYYEQSFTTIPGTPEQGTPTIDQWVAGDPATGEPTMELWVDGTPAVGEATIQVPNPAHVPADDVQVCEMPKPYPPHVGAGDDIVVIPGMPCEATEVFSTNCWLNVPPADLDVVCEEAPSWWECDLLINELDGTALLPGQPVGTVATVATASTPSAPVSADNATGLADTGGDIVGSSLVGLALVTVGVAAVIASRVRRATASR